MSELEAEIIVSEDGKRRKIKLNEFETIKLLEMLSIFTMANKELSMLLQ